MRHPPTIVIDTNVFVAALFRKDSHAGRLVEHVRRGRTRMIWHRETKQETRAIVERIPPIDWADVCDLFQKENEFDSPIDPTRFDAVPDPDDRRFAALAHAVGAVLVSQDDDLLGCPERLNILVLTPKEFLERDWWASEWSGTPIR